MNDRDGVERRTPPGMSSTARSGGDGRALATTAGRPLGRWITGHHRDDTPQPGADA